MKNIKYKYSVIALITSIILLWSAGCKRDFDELELAKFPNTPEIFIDGFSKGLNYAAFGGSKVTAFDVDMNEKYAGSASMKIEVPDAGDPEGAYAGGVYFTTVGRDLSEYDALTFWAKASKSASIDLVGFGNDLEDSKYLVSLKDVNVNTNWKKYIIPIPDPSKLTEERGMFYYSEGPEDGKGYTIWIDEVTFEKLGTLAHRKSRILDGSDKVESAVNGLSIPVGGLSVSFNMPTGIDQSVIAAPAYYSFASSNVNVATINDAGLVTVLSEGTSIITAKLANENADGSLTIQSSGEFTHAPAPTADPEDVISIFSNAYTNVPVDFYNGYWEPYQTTLSSDFTVNDDDVLYYTNFNFVGIQFTSPTVDASDMTHLHMDVWIPNAVGPSDRLSAKIVDLGQNGILDETDTSISYEIPGPLVSKSWISVDINISSLSSRSKVAQIILENLNSPLSGFYLDNVYFYESGGATVTEPTVAAPTPPDRNAADVISIYSDAYTNLAGSDYPDWGQSTVVSGVSVAGNNTLKFAGLNFQGIQLASSQDISAMEFLHIDYWTVNSSALNVFLISTGPVETAHALTVPAADWSSVDIPLSDFSTVDLTDLIQMKFDGNGDIYLDNIYFYKSGGGTSAEPTVAAPVPPARDAADVISLFSNAYTNNPVDTWSASWDDSDVSDFQIGSDDIKKYTFTNFAGIDFSNNKFDASAMTHFHMDIWTPDEVLSKSLSIKNVDFGGGNAEVSSHILTVVHTPSGDVPALATGTWVSIDVPITDFNGNLTRTDLAQMVLTSNLSTVYVDNIYFYKSGGGTATEPTVAAPVPPARDAADVISIFSGAYTDVTGTDFNPSWGQSTVVTLQDIQGNSTLKYANLNYQGIQLASSQNVSGMEFVHIDYWTANSTALNTFLISQGPVEKAYALTVPSSGWSSVDIPLSSFSPVDLANIIQFKFDGNGDIYLDNIYFYKTAGTATVPAVAAPAPPARNAADVISLFSGAYTDITGTNFNPAWGQSTVVTLEDIAGNSTLKYANFNFQGTTFAAPLDASAMDYLHVDMWTPDATVVQVSPINGSGSPTEHLVSLTPIVARQWNSYDIPLTDFTNSGMTINDLIQMKFDGQAGVSPSNIYLDNIYFYKSGTSPGTGPATAAPTPPARNAQDVISLFSGAYTNVTVDNWDADWGNTCVLEDIKVAGDDVKKYVCDAFAAIDFSGHKFDASSMTHFHMDLWTPTAVLDKSLTVKFVDFGGGSAEATNLILTVVHTAVGDVPALQKETWVSIDVPITAFSGDLTRTDLAQVALTTNLGTIYVDNIYFYK